MDNLVHSLLFTNIHKTTYRFSKERKKCENVRRYYLPGLATLKTAED